MGGQVVDTFKYRGRKKLFFKFILSSTDTPVQNILDSSPVLSATYIGEGSLYLSEGQNFSGWTPWGPDSEIN